MEALLFIIYFIACCVVLWRIKFIRNSALPVQTVLWLFIIQAGAGCVLGLANHYLLHNDTDYDYYNKLGLIEYNNLIHNPRLFFTDIFRSNYAEYGEFFGTKGSYWNDLRVNIILKILGVMDIFSRGNYYINSLFFNFFGFFGHVALYRVFATIYPQRKNAVIVGCFLLPSMLYFTSGIHKDLIVFTALGIFSYCMYCIAEGDAKARKLILLCLSLLTILLIRNFVAFILIPCAVAYFISKKYSFNPIKTFAAMLVILFAGIIALHVASPKFDPLNIVVARQQSFFALGTASSQYQNDTLVVSLKSFATAAPRALRHSFLSPLPGEFSSFFMNLFSAEMIVYVLLFVLMLLFPLYRQGSSEPFLIFGVAFTLIIFLFMGYITPAAGALVRYRSIYFPFILTPVLASINWQN